MQREKGASVATCPSCGDDVELVAQPDGSVAQAACTGCHTGRPAYETAAVQPDPVPEQFVPDPPEDSDADNDSEDLA